MYIKCTNIQVNNITCDADSFVNVDWLGNIAADHKPFFKAKMIEKSTHDMHELEGPIHFI